MYMAQLVVKAALSVKSATEINKAIESMKEIDGGTLKEIKIETEYVDGVSVPVLHIIVQV